MDRQWVVLHDKAGSANDERLGESHKLRHLVFLRPCGGQVISDSLIGFFDVDSRSKALGDKLPSFECSLMLL